MPLVISAIAGYALPAAGGGGGGGGASWLYGALVKGALLPTLIPLTLTVTLTLTPTPTLIPTLTLLTLTLGLTLTPAPASTLTTGALLAAFASAAVFLGDGFDLVVTVGGASVVTAVSVGLPLAANLKLFHASLGRAELAANVRPLYIYA